MVQSPFQQYRYHQLLPYVITLYVQMYTVPSWEILSPILLSTSTSESSSKSEAFTKKEKKLTAQKKNMKFAKFH